MDEQTRGLVRYFYATTRIPVPVVVCTACRAERALSPGVVADTGYPARCAQCGGGAISIDEYVVDASGQVCPKAPAKDL